MAAPNPGMAPPRMRVDKWLWQARFFKTRSLAAKCVTSGHLRINGLHAAKASALVGQGDTLTFPQGRQVRVIEIVDIGTRRGPAPEAQALYLDQSPAPPPRPQIAAKNPAFEGGGRPTKKARRAWDAGRPGPDEPTSDPESG